MNKQGVQEKYYTFTNQVFEFIYVKQVVCDQNAYLNQKPECHEHELSIHYVKMNCCVIYSA